MKHAVAMKSPVRRVVIKTYILKIINTLQVYEL